MKTIIVSGIHGNEPNACRVVNEFIGSCEEDIVVFNYVNKEAIKKGVRSVDGNDWNRMWKSDMHGMPRDFVEFAESVMDVESSGKLGLIDVHASPDLLPCAVIDNVDIAPFCVKVFDELGIPYAIVNKKSTLKSFANDRGIYAVTAEVNGMTMSAMQEKNVELLSKLICSLDKIAQEFTTWKDRYILCEDGMTPMHNSELMYTKYTPIDGMLCWERGLPYGEYKKGEKIATVWNDFDQHDIFAETDGWVIDVEDRCTVETGDSLFEFQPKVSLERFML